MNAFGVIFGLVFAQVWFIAYLLALWHDCYAIFRRLRAIRSTLDQAPKPPNRICHARSQDLQHKVPSSSKTHVYLRLCLLFGKLLTPYQWFIFFKPGSWPTHNPYLQIAAVISGLVPLTLNPLGSGLIFANSCDAWKRNLFFSAWPAFCYTVFVGSWLGLSAPEIFGVAGPCGVNIGVNLAMAWHQGSGERPCFWDD